METRWRPKAQVQLRRPARGARIGAVAPYGGARQGVTGLLTRLQLQRPVGSPTNRRSLLVPSGVALHHGARGEEPERGGERQLVGGDVQQGRGEPRRLEAE